MLLMLWLKFRVLPVLGFKFYRRLRLYCVRGMDGSFKFNRFYRDLRKH